MSLNMHGTQYSISQHYKFLQNIEASLIGCVVVTYTEGHPCMCMVV